MEWKILEYVRDCPYCRQRYIAKACHTWFLNEDFLNALQRLYKGGFIDCRYHHDPAQMEFYNEWYLTNKGECAIMNVENKEGDFIYG